MAAEGIEAKQTMITLLAATLSAFTFVLEKIFKIKQ